MQDRNDSLRRRSGNLNVFQRSMLQWNSMHPYNAVHVVRVPGRPDQERLRHFINQVIESRSLTGLTLNIEHGTFHYRGGSALCEINSLELVQNPRSSLAAEIE